MDLCLELRPSLVTLDVKNSCLHSCLSTQQLTAHNSFALAASKVQRDFSHISCFWNLGNLITYRWRSLHLSLIEPEEGPPGRDEDLTVGLTTK